MILSDVLTASSAVEFNSNKFVRHTLAGTNWFSFFTERGLHESFLRIQMFKWIRSSHKRFRIQNFRTRGTKPRRFTIDFVAAFVNGNMNPVLKRSGFVIIERLRYPGFGVRVRVVSSCFTDVCNSIILFLFSCNRQWYNAKNVHLNCE